MEKNFLKNYCEVINPTNSPPPRFGHTVNLVSKTTVIVFGGAISSPGNYTMTADLYLYNMATNTWKKLDPLNNVMPHARAAHASATVRENQLLVYGGSIGNGQYATDDLWFLDIKNNDEASWMKVPIEGPTPLWRYGHTMVYIMPILILYGGSGRSEIINDVWMLSTDKSPFKWEKTTITGNYPIPRVYHTANLYKVTNQPEMMIIYGGRAQDNSSHNDIMGLKKVKNNEWEWHEFSKSKNSQDIQPVSRHQHCAAFFGPFLFIVGGRVSSKENATFDVYSTIKQKWYRFGLISLFRHSIWVYYNITSHDNFEVFLYIYGGFDGDNNSMINSNLYKINIANLFSSEESLRNDLNDHISMLFTLRIQKNQKLAPKQQDEKVFVLSNKVVIHTVGEDFGDIVRKFSLQKLKEEHKKTRGNCADITKKYVYDENLIKEYLNLLPLRENFKARGMSDIQKFQRDSFLSLIQEAKEIFENTPTLIKLRSPIKIFGSINGQYNDLIRYFNFWGRPSEHQGDIESFEYLFIGNYVNRGNFSVEVLCLLLSLKVKYPSQFHMIRGSHEDYEISKTYGLYDECRIKFDEDPDKPDSVFKNICALFEYIPLAATVNNKILCIHSGIGENIKSLDDISSIKKPINIYENQKALDLLWAVPSENTLKEEYYGNNFTNILRQRFFNESMITDFMKSNNIDLVIRSHDVLEKGFEKLFSNKVCTIFSATNYCNTHNNDGGIIFVKKNLEIQPKILPLEENMALWWPNDNNMTKWPPSPKKSWKKN